MDSTELASKIEVQGRHISVVWDSDSQRVSYNSVHEDGDAWVYGTIRFASSLKDAEHQVKEIVEGLRRK